jgi:dephospho-CoA kinase
MFLIGLTGGIASGKSTVADQWQRLGAEVIDADELARVAVAPGSAGLRKVVETFGSKLLLETGELDRRALANLIFNESSKRKKLESILHPIIRQLAEERIQKSNSELVVYVIPLLVEAQTDLLFDFVVTVEAPDHVRAQRLVTNRGLTPEEATSRIMAQASSVERANVADRILNSNQDLELFLKASRQLFAELEKMAAQKGKE